MSYSRDCINHAKKELTEFMKGTAFFREEHYLSNFSEPICSLLKPFRRHPEVTYELIDVLNLDALHADIQIIPFYDSNGRINYCRYEEIKKLRYPSANFEVVDGINGMYKNLANGKIKYSKRIAIDFMFEYIAQRWLNEIPKLLKLFK